MIPDPTQAQTRIERTLRFIHCHLDQPLAVSSLAVLAGWSRWQFQRVFTAHTGLSVAQYVRELRLSKAAELLLTTRERQLDIALACGFESDISFSRSFRQHFGCPPGQYRKRGRRCQLCTPLPISPIPSPPPACEPWRTRIRVESRPAFEVVGLCDEISGIYSPAPDFARRIPELWNQLLTHYRPPADALRLGVMDVSRAGSSHRFPYWAGIESHSWPDHPALARQTVPAQEYAVIPFRGPASSLDVALSWFLEQWLPASGYEGCYGFDLEVYPPHTLNPKGANIIELEYWVPIRTVTARESSMHQMVK